MGSEIYLLVNHTGLIRGELMPRKQVDLLPIKQLVVPLKRNELFPFSSVCTWVEHL